MPIDRAGFSAYMKHLGKAAGVRIETLDDLRMALLARLDFFESMDASVSDHSLDFLMWESVPEAEVETIFARALLARASRVTRSTSTGPGFWAFLPASTRGATG